ncbi:MAG TPA: hypothetical protein VK025_05750 [Steroidobacter sp.]|nr:hypothetical protein [Steroidobacteraceae bacterium]HLS80889.1 hypothetical protein [Steroidobacter sp.]
MNTASKTTRAHLLTAASAANADRLDDGCAVDDRRGDAQRRQGDRPHAALRSESQSAGGWDAYDVWRRFIKEARDRRRNGGE